MNVTTMDIYLYRCDFKSIKL